VTRWFDQTRPEQLFWGVFSLAAGPLIAILGDDASNLMGSSSLAAAHVQLANNNVPCLDTSEDFQDASQSFQSFHSHQQSLLTLEELRSQTGGIASLTSRPRYQFPAATGTSF
jgi:hypothetical protein